MGNKILIVGGAGFLGAHLCEELLAHGEEDILVLDNHSNSVPDNLQEAAEGARRLRRDAPPHLELQTAEVEDAAAWGTRLREVRAVVHFAAFTRVVESLQQPEACYRVNIHGLTQVLEQCRKHQVRRFVFASSNAAVGEAVGRTDESTLPRPLSPYGATKLIGEALCCAYAHAYGMETVALRFANAYGPYCQRKGSVVAKFLRRVLAGQPLTIYGDGTQTRDFIHARDIARAVHGALAVWPASAQPSSPYRLYQIASGINTSVKQLVEVLAAATGTQPAVRYEPARQGEILHSRSAPDLIARELGFRAETSLSDGVADLHRWMLADAGHLQGAQVAGE